MPNMYPMVVTMKMGHGSNNTNLIGWNMVVRMFNLHKRVTMYFSLSMKEMMESYIFWLRPFQTNANAMLNVRVTSIYARLLVKQIFCMPRVLLVLHLHPKKNFPMR
jgi:hypothetical protein